MKQKDLKNFLEFLHQAEGLKSVLRHSWMSSGRKESVAEHSWRFALMAMILAPKIDPKINLLKLLKMILVHDLPEVYAGDHRAFKKSQPNKADLEQKAMIKILKPLDKKTQTELLNLWKEYELAKSPEAKFAKALDKLEVLIQHNEASIKTWNQKEFSFNFEHGDQYCLYDPTLWQLRELIKDDCFQKIVREYTHPRAN